MAHLLRIFWRTSPVLFILTLLGAALEGGTNALFIALINRQVHATELHWTAVVSLVALSAGTILSSAMSRVALARLCHTLAYRLTISTARHVLSTQLATVESVGSARLLRSMIEDVNEISRGAASMPLVLTSGSLLVGCMVYLAWLSPSLVIVVIGGMAAGALGQVYLKRRFKELRRRAAKLAATAIANVQELIGGIKELKLSRLRRDAFLARVLDTTAAARRTTNIGSANLSSATEIWGRLLFFLLIALILFGRPILPAQTGPVITGYVLTVLYMMTPFRIITNQAMMATAAAVSLEQIEELHARIGDDRADDGAVSAVVPVAPIELRLRGVSHHYYHERQDETFTLGPIDLELRSGEIVLVVGGNGSGKTTLAKILCGLYKSPTGDIVLNGKPIGPDDELWYREHFSTVFSDYHLFESLLGIDDTVVDELARDYLERLHIAHKLEVRDGVYSTTKLSQGQRKRLALMTAYLEDRPVIVLDEWAADQDPSFRELFYRQMLPELRSKGKALLVITHDDRYFGIADRIVKLEEGKVVAVSDRDAIAAAAGQGS